MEPNHNLPFNLCKPKTKSTIINRSYSLLQSIAITSLIYYRLSSFSYSKPSSLHLLVFASELILSLLWLLSQAYLWRPVSRTTFPERLKEEKKEELPRIDVFICTADPKKEPPLEVMNTVLSAMALDYPIEKLSVYVSDDGGSELTLHAMREGWKFGRYWLPFCKKFGIKTRCPKAYFTRYEDDVVGPSPSIVGYEEEREKIKQKYRLLEEHVKKAERNGQKLEDTCNFNSTNHPAHVEVIHDEYNYSAEDKMPLLVYVSREKSPFHPHHFKAGALNALLRVSTMISNSPYILVLDCDMRCHDPTSALQAMCFHLDPKISSNLAFVQFPQKFHNLSHFDIYDGQLRLTFSVRWPGMDGLQGPMLSGTGFYIKRKALYGDIVQQDTDAIRLKQYLGPSNELAKSLHQSNHHNSVNNTDFPSRLLEETRFLASCTYEKDTQWGKKVGFLYNSVIEDYFTGFLLHCKGWNSLFCNPARPAFLGSATTKLNDTLLQGARWNCGVFQVTFSRFSPLFYGLSRMSLLQTMCYAYLSLQPLYFFPMWCLATIPQLCLLNAIPLYPKASNSWFMIFSYIFIMSQLKHLEEVRSTGDPMRTWWNEQRIWMMKAVISYTIGIMNATLKFFGLKEANFVPTNKVADDEQVTFYQKGIFNFQASTVVLVPLVTLVTLNMISFAGGIARIVMNKGSWNEMFGQIVLTFYILMLHYPIVEGMVFRKDKGRIRLPITLLSLAISTSFLLFGSLILK